MHEGLRGYRFGPFELELKTRELSRDGVPSRMAEKPFLALTALLERPGELVTRAELSRRLWPDGTHVDFANNLHTAIASLREQLGESARAPRRIETFPRLGYRFVGDVQPVGAAPSGRRRSHRFALVAPLLAVGGLLLWGTQQATPPAPAAAPDDPAARAAYLRGMALLRSPGKPAGEAVASLAESVRLDPGFARAHAAHAEALVHAAFASRDPRASLDAARQAAERGLRLDASLPNAHRALAAVALHLDWDVARAESHVEAALAHDSDDGYTQLAAAALRSVQGRHDDAVVHARRAVELDPASHLVRSDLGYFLLAAGRHREACDASRLALELEPDFEPALTTLLLAEERLGDRAAAATTARRILQLAGAGPGTIAALDRDGLAAFHRWQLDRVGEGSPLLQALALAALGERQAAVDRLERSFDQREPFLIYLAGYAQLQALHDDPRFATLCRRLGVS